MKTEKQELFETHFIALVKSAGKLLVVEFVSKEGCRSTIRDESRNITKSSFGSNSAAVSLTLVEGDDIDVWFDALKDASENLDKLKQQNEWAAANPNFFAAISSKYYQTR